MCPEIVAVVTAFPEPLTVTAFTPSVIPYPERVVGLSVILDQEDVVGNVERLTVIVLPDFVIDDT